MATVLYGIANCDSVKKARRWLDEHAVPYRFHDFRSDGLEPGVLAAWMDTLGWEVLINRRSSSWRELDPETRSSMDAASAIQAALATPTLIKRPLLSHGGTLETGFSAARYAEIFRC